jgi:PKD domain/Bacterial Ig-like domain (group 1)
MPVSGRFAVFITILFLACLLVSACKEATVAPGGTVLNITAEPQQIAINGSSVLTGSGSSDGAPLADGTVLRFVLETGTGRITPASATVNNGSAIARFFASGVEGKATISVISGSAIAKTDIEVIGDTNERVSLIANPPDLPSGGGTTTLTAVVTDSLGNPREGDRVLFTTTAGALKSSGQFVLTNAQGHASDELTTDRTAEVTAEVVDVSADSPKITIPVGTAEIECSFTVSPENPSVGTAVTFTDTTEIDSERIFNSIWDFGDGTTMSGVSVQHTYNAAGTFRVAHVLVDISGNSFTCPSLRLTVS